MIALLPLAGLYVLTAVVLDVDLVLIGVGAAVVQFTLVRALLPGEHLASARTAVWTYAVFLTVVSLISYHQSITIGTLQQPHLMGSDGEGYFRQALILSNGDILINITRVSSNYIGYQVALAISFALFKDNLLVGLIVNNTALLAAVSLIVSSTYCATQNSKAAFFSGLLFILTPKFIYYANALLKEPFLLLGIALVVYGSVLVRERRGTFLVAYSCIALATLIFGTMRLTMLPAVFALFPIIAGKEVFRKGLPLVLVGMVLSGAMISFFLNFTSYQVSETEVVDVVSANSILDESFNRGKDSGGVVGSLMAGYTKLPLVVRVFSAPVPVLIQFLLPFDFWNVKFIEGNIFSVFNSNLNFVWYLYVGMHIIFSLVFWRHIKVDVLKYMLAFGAAAYVGVALIFGGVVPRYASPFIVLMFPAAGYCMSYTESASFAGAKFLTFSRFYYICFAMAGFAYGLFALSR